MTYTVKQGDALEVARGMEPESVHCIITSPPYWGLRDYAASPMIWGGDPECRHEWEEASPRRQRSVNDVKNPDSKQATNTGSSYEASGGAFCIKCEAWVGNLGLEPTPELYVQHLVEMFREFKPVLRDDGTLWLNMGDSYAGGGGSSGHTSETKNFGRRTSSYGAVATAGYVPLGLKPLDLCMIPARVAMALQADGWYLRGTIIWNKPNPMPESQRGWRWEKHKIQVEAGKRNVKVVGGVEHWNQGGQSLRETVWADCPGCEKCLPHGGYVLRKGSWRPTTSHEYIFLLSKTDTYFCDEHAVREPAIRPGDIQTFGGAKGREYTPDKDDPNYRGGKEQWGRTVQTGLNGRNLRSVWTFPAGQADWEYCNKCKSLYTGKARSRVIRTYFVEVKRGEWVRYKLPPLGSRHVRMVRNWCDANPGWLKFVIIRKCPDCKSTEHWVDHFAAFPLRLPELCIKAGTSEKGVCKKCGAPWVRVVERKPSTMNIRVRDAKKGTLGHKSGHSGKASASQKEIAGYGKEEMGDYKTINWLPSCDCDAGDSVPAVVLDPFCGSGQTLVAAHKLGRDSVGIDLKKQYCDVTTARLKELASQLRLKL